MATRARRSAAPSLIPRLSQPSLNHRSIRRHLQPRLRNHGPSLSTARRRRPSNRIRGLSPERSPQVSRSMASLHRRPLGRSTVSLRPLSRSMASLRPLNQTRGLSRVRSLHPSPRMASLLRTARHPPTASSHRHMAKPHTASSHRHMANPRMGSSPRRTDSLRTGLPLVASHQPRASARIPNRTRRRLSQESGR
jgi:hypothetical protein